MLGLWPGFMVCLSFSRGVGLFLFRRLSCWPVCGVWFLVVSPLPGVWAWFYLVGWPVGICWFLYRANAPFLMFIGEVLSIFHFL